MSEYTKGPWRVFKSTDGFTSVYPAKADVWLAESVGFALQGPRQTVAIDVREEDAHLIAAAPELLEALKAVVYDAQCRSFYIRPEALDKAQTAIRKAEEDGE